MKSSGTVKRLGPLAVAKRSRPRHLHFGFATLSLDNFSKLFNLPVSLLPWKRMQKSKMAVWRGLTNSCEKKRREKQRRKGKI